MQELIRSIVVVIVLGTLTGYLLAILRHFRNELKKDRAIGTAALSKGKMYRGEFLS